MKKIVCQTCMNRCVSFPKTEPKCILLYLDRKPPGVPDLADCREKKKSCTETTVVAAYFWTRPGILEFFLWSAYPKPAMREESSVLNVYEPLCLVSETGTKVYFTVFGPETTRCTGSSRLPGKKGRVALIMLVLFRFCLFCFY